MPDTSIDLSADARAQVRRTVDELRTSFQSGLTRPYEFRRQQLERLAAMLVEAEDALVEALAKDLGKPALESWMSEVGFVSQEVAHTLKHLSSWMKPERVTPTLAVQPASALVQREPLGVILDIAPWNYPMQLAFGSIAPMIAAGNCVVLKPSELAPASSAVIARLVSEYLDPRVVRVVEGGIPETQALLEERFDHIFYTGNGTVGRIVMRAAAEHLTPVTLELGGKSPCIVDSTANLDVAARRILFGKLINSGQSCVAPDYILVDASVHDALVAKLIETIRSFHGANPQESADYGRMINARHFDRVLRLLEGQKIAYGGRSDRDALYIDPTILIDVDPDSAVMKEEIFGPVLPVLKVANVDAAIRFSNAREKPLALYVFTEDGAVADRVLAETTSGGVCVNDTVTHVSVPNLPFGGVGESGMGAYHGKAGFDTFSNLKGVLRKGTFLDPMLRYPPYDAQKAKWIRRLA